MKILMVTMSLGIGGAETHILELTRELVRRGHDVTVASGGGIFVDSLLASGAHHIEAPLYSKRPDIMARAYRILSAQIRKNRYDILHAHARIPGFLSSLLAARYDIPFVTTFHGVFNPVWYLRMLTRVGSRTLAVSDDVRDYLMTYYHTPPENITVTVNGIDVESFSAAGRQESPILPEMREGERILCITRLDQASAWHVFRLMEAMPGILEARPAARLVIVGGGDVLEEVAEMARRTNEILGKQRIFVIGPRKDISQILPDADVFVGVSRAAMEAMACEIPVVLSGAQGHLGVYTPAMEEEAIATNFCCRGREPADADTLMQNILDVLSRPASERKQMGAANREVVCRLYSVARMTDDAEELYRRAVRAFVPKHGDIVISGYYGFQNAGDDALLASIVHGLKQRNIRRISVLSRKNSQPAEGVRAVSRFRFPAVMREIRRAGLLVSGGGSLLQDATSTKSLLYYTWIMRYAHRVGTPVMVMANGIGPLRRPENRRRALRALRDADFISVREESSRDELIAMGVDAKRIRVTADPVFLLPAVLPPEASPAEKPYLVVSLRERAGGAEKGEDPAALQEAVVTALKTVCREQDLAVVFLPMQPRYDEAICHRAAQRLREAGLRASVVSDLRFPQISALCRDAEAVIAMRLHALIFAAAEATPTVALSYDPKIDGLMAYLGTPQWTLPAYSASADQIAQAVLRLLTERECLSEQLRARSAEFAARAGEDLDRAAAFLEESSPGNA